MVDYLVCLNVQTHILVVTVTESWCLGKYMRKGKHLLASNLMLLQD